MFNNLEQRCPDIYVNDERVLRRIPRPRLLKSHEMFDARYAKVIYLVRDPRDVAVSYRRFLIKMRVIDDDYGSDAFIGDLLAGRFDSYGTWGANVGSWIDCGLPAERLTLVRYEDLHEKATPTVARLADFLNLAVSHADIARALELSSSRSMRDLEQREMSTNDQLKVTRQDIPFVGNAEVGRGAALSEAHRAAIEGAWHPLMKRLGY